MYKAHMYLDTVQSTKPLNWTTCQFTVLPTSTDITLDKLTLSRMMSISEYFIPLTSTGVSLEKKPEEKL